MARIRSIKPDFFTSLVVASLPVHARLTFIGLWTHVDDEGRCVDDARLIKAAVWPLDDRLSSDVEEDLKMLSESSLITRYTVNDRSYLAVKGWSEHQRINRPTRSKLPFPPEGPDDPNAAPSGPPPPPVSRKDAPVTESSLSPTGPVTEDSLAEGNREQGTGNRENYTPSAPRPDEADIAELVSEPENLPALTVVPENAGQIVRSWIDHCTSRDVKLTQSIIKRYAVRIAEALKQGFTPDLIRRALGQMLEDREAARPSLLDNYLVRAQTGPARHPRRMTPGEAAASRHAPAGSNVAALIHDALTRPA